MAIVFRSYAKDPALVDEIVGRALTSIRKANSLGFDRVMVVVPTDYDRGGVPLALARSMRVKAPALTAEILAADGHHSSGALNQALAALRGTVNYVAIVSHKATGYLSASVLARAVEQLESGIKVVGVRISELDDVHESPIENTLAIWNLEELMLVGGFDSDLGVEEVAPLVRLMQKFGACAALVSACSDTAKLDIRASGDGVLRHNEVKSTKRERQALEATRVGVTLEWIKSNIIAS